MNGLQDILRPILLAVSAEVLDYVALNEREFVLEDELRRLNWHVVMLSSFLSL